MVSQLNTRQRAWFNVEQRHGDELLEIVGMAKSIGPDAAFALLLQHIPTDPAGYRAAMHPLFQSALLVGAEILHRQDEREKIWRDKGK